MCPETSKTGLIKISVACSIVKPYDLTGFAGVLEVFWSRILPQNAFSMHSVQLDVLFRIKGRFMVSKILAPTDGSKAARKAVRYTVDLAKQLNASVIILSVVDIRAIITFAIPAVNEPTEDYLREAAKGYAGEIKKLCDESGVQSEIIIRTGHPVEDIVKEAEKSKVDLIIMGSHGRSALSAAVLGSVAYGVIHNQTKVPVLIVRRD